DEDDLVMMKAYKQDETVQFDMEAGSQNDEFHYRELLEFVRQNDLSKQENIKHLETLMDIDNYLEYVAYQIYYANTDSFSNNLMLWRKKTSYLPEAPYGHDGRWRWMIFDLDFGMGFNIMDNLGYKGDLVDYNMVSHVMKDEERMTLFRNLMDHEETRNDFIKIMLNLLNNNFEPEHVKNKIDELASAIRPEIPHSIKRWENIESIEQWEKNLDELRRFAEKRPKIIKEHIMEEFEITEEMLDKLEKEDLQDY